jgi:hypothetical protein
LPKSFKNHCGDLTSSRAFSSLHLSFRNLCAIYKIHPYIGFAYRPSEDYPMPELSLLPDANSRNFSLHPGRGSSKREPLLYQLILLWISCLPCLPNLTSEKQASPSMSQVSCGKKLISYQIVTNEHFWLYVASGRSLDLPSVCSAEFGPVRS